MLHSRLGCSTISFRHLTLDRALAWIAALGFTEIDLGALPGICDHVPYELTRASVDAVAGTVTSSGLAVRSINCDIGDLNRPLDADTRVARDGHLDMLLTLAVATGSRALVLPCGAVDHHPAESLDADLDRVADELMRAADRTAPTAWRCGRSRSTSTGCAGTSNVHNNSPTGSPAVTSEW